MDTYHTQDNNKVQRITAVIPEADYMRQDLKDCRDALKKIEEIIFRKTVNQENESYESKGEETQKYFQIIIDKFCPGQVKTSKIMDKYKYRISFTINAVNNSDRYINIAVRKLPIFIIYFLCQIIESDYSIIEFVKIYKTMRGTTDLENSSKKTDTLALQYAKAPESLGDKFFNNLQSEFEKAHEDLIQKIIYEHLDRIAKKADEKERRAGGEKSIDLNDHSSYSKNLLLDKKDDTQSSLSQLHSSKFMSITKSNSSGLLSFITSPSKVGKIEKFLPSFEFAAKDHSSEDEEKHSKYGTVNGKRSRQPLSKPGNEKTQHRDQGI